MTAAHRLDQEIARQLEAERARLELALGLERKPVVQFRRPIERPFTAAERDTVTILFGGLTWRHERLLGAALQAAGYRAQLLPTPDLAAFQLGKEYGNNGQCNPVYFTVGQLIKSLLELEASGLSRQEIVDRYVFLTAGSCGPCRFGMYEAEYRLALRNAGFDGFRIVLFQQARGIKAQPGEPGLRFTVDLGMNALNAFTFADVLNDLAHQIRPYELKAGETDRVLQQVIDELAAAMRGRKMFELRERVPGWLAERAARRGWLRNTLNTTGKVLDHLRGRQTVEMLRRGRGRLDEIEVDRFRVKPVVKVTGEFWAQTTEGDGNFRMFDFLEREGAEVVVEPIGNWISYLIWFGRARTEAYGRPETQQSGRHSLADTWEFRKKLALLSLGMRLFGWHYRHAVRRLGDLAHPLLDMEEIARLARPYYHPLLRGGEGHTEVGKTIYCSTRQQAHMVLSLKPFGCMPSSQSDGVQSTVMSHFPDLIFLPVETSGEGAANAYSRVQMALGDARGRARDEFARTVAATGKRLDDLRAYVADHPELRRALYKVPRRPGVIGAAANFVLHVSDILDRRARPISWRFALRRVAGADAQAQSGPELRPDASRT